MVGSCKFAYWKILNPPLFWENFENSTLSPFLKGVTIVFAVCSKIPLSENSYYIKTANQLTGLHVYYYFLQNGIFLQYEHKSNENGLCEK